MQQLMNRVRRDGGLAPDARNDGDVDGSLDPRLVSTIRRELFRSAGVAGRYRVAADDVLVHLVRAGLAMAPRPERAVQHLPDIILAVACIRGDATAWNDLLNAHASCLDRACAETLGTSPGLAFARRFWRDLRLATAEFADDHPERRCPARLQSYAGLRSLRLWLADRLLGGAALVAWGGHTGTAPCATLRAAP